MKRILAVAGVGVFVGLVALAAFAFSRSQRADNGWDSKVSRPAYAAEHPRVVIDEAHHNAHTAGGKYRPFARLLEADGYDVAKGKQKLTPESLAGVAVLVIVNASGGPKPQIFGINIPIPTRKKREDPAFTSDEIQAVRSWVEQGGSLVLIADHAPFGAAAEKLAEAFGVRMNKGFVEVPGVQSDPLVFSSGNGLLGDHPILSGGSAENAVRRVMTFTGQSLDGPPEASILLRLPPSAIEYVPPGPELKPQPAGKAQGLALPCGRGRIVVLGEAGMLTAQVSEGKPFGMNLPDNDNRQFALNMMHWLSRRL
jgi:hypothetical protein